MLAWSSCARLDSNTSPRLASTPGETMLSPVATRLVISTASPWRDVYSSMTIASAPLGAAAPVMIATAWPESMFRPSGVAPALISPMTCNVAGSCSKSEARTAYPSRAARGKGGKSRSASTDSAKIRPLLSIS